jgi:hypothetical protein
MQPQIRVGDVTRKVFDIYVEEAVVFVFTGILSTVLATGGSGLRLLSLLVSLVAITLFTGMVVELVADVQDGRRDSSPRQLLGAVAPVLWQLIGVAIVAAVGITVGLVALVVPGLYLITMWSLIAPVVVLERPPGLGALGRSRELVRGNGWRVFAVIIVFELVITIIAGLIELAADSAGTGVGLVVTVVLGVLTAPLAALAAAVLYFQLRGASTAAPPVVAPAAPDTPDPFDAG